MRVLLMLSSFGGGGAERRMISVGSELSARGREITMLVSRSNGPLRKDVDPRVRIIELQGKRARFSILEVRSILRSLRPDAILASQPHVNMLAVISNMAAGNVAPVILREANVPSRMAEERGGLNWHMSRWLMPRVYRKADRVVAVSHGVRRDLVEVMGLSASRVTTIHNGIVDGRLYRRMRGTCTFDWPTGEGETARFVTVGRLAKEKNHDRLLHAFKGVAEVQPAHLAIAGAGPEREDLEVLRRDLELEDQVTFLGEVDNPMPLFRSAHVAVLTSNHEGLPSVLIEALAADCEVVATDCPGGVSEILRDGQYGWLVPLNDVESLSSAMLDAAVPEKSRNPDAEAAVAPFRTERMVSEYDALLEDIAHRRP